jgi:hypothetical protein
MNAEDFKGLRYYIIYSLVVVGFFVYSGMTGWMWFNPTSTEPERPATSRSGGHVYRYHK